MRAAGAGAPEYLPKYLTDYQLPAGFFKGATGSCWNKLRIDELPNISTKKQWLLAFKTSVMAGSGWMDDVAVSRWCDEAININFGWDELKYSGGTELGVLDFMLAQEMMKFFTSKNKTDLVRRIFQYRQTQQNESRTLANGRQVVNLA